MNTAPCPHCGDLCQVPSDLRPEAQLRCPWCGEMSRGQEVLEQLPPPFEVVSSEAADATSRAFAELAAMAEQEEDGKEGFLSPGGSEEGDHDEGETAEPLSLVTGDSEPPSGRVLRQARSADAGRRQAELVKIVAGALLAVPAATMILLWLPGRWQRDPLGIGPTLGRYAPWIVPANLRPGYEEEAETPEPARPNERPRKSSSTAGSSPLPRLGEGLADTPDSKNASSAPRSPTTVSASADATRHHRLAEEDKPTGDARANNGASRRKQPAGTHPTPQEPVSSPAPPADPMTSGDGEMLGVYNAPHFEAADFERSLGAAESAWDTWHNLAQDEQLDPAVRDRVRGELLAALYDLGETTVYVDPEAPEIPELAKRATALLEAISEDAKLLAYVGNQSAQHLAQKQRPRDGVLIYGTVVRIEPHGHLFVTTVKLASRKKAQIGVLSFADPAAYYHKGSRILLLGTVVDQPAMRVAGYNGEAGRIVVGGVPYALPKQ